MELNISTSDLNDFFGEVLAPYQSFAEILRHVQQDPKLVELELWHVGHVLNALNALAEGQLIDLVQCAENGIGEVYVDRIVHSSHAKIGAVYLKSSQRPAQKPKSAARSKDAVSQDFHTDAQIEHLSAGNSSVQST